MTYLCFPYGGIQSHASGSHIEEFNDASAFHVEEFSETPLLLIWKNSMTHLCFPYGGIQ
jgi:hypothetical protein